MGSHACTLHFTILFRCTIWKVSHFNFQLHSSPQKWSTLKLQNLLLWEQILSFKSRPFWTNFLALRMKQEVTKDIALRKMAENHVTERTFRCSK